MKASKLIRSIILIALFSLSAGFIFAEGTEARSAASINGTVSFNMISLTPKTPTEATFEDDVTWINLANLAPVTPDEATFEEAFESRDILIPACLTPATPAEADFSDDENITAIDITMLAPVMPKVASFEDLL